MFIFNISLEINFLFNDSLIDDGYWKIRWLDNFDFFESYSFLDIENKFKIDSYFILILLLQKRFLFFFSISLKINFLFNDRLIGKDWLETDNSEFVHILFLFFTLMQ